MIVVHCTTYNVKCSSYINKDMCTTLLMFARSSMNYISPSQILWCVTSSITRCRLYNGLNWLTGLFAAYTYVNFIKKYNYNYNYFCMYFFTNSRKYFEKIFSDIIYMSLQFIILYNITLLVLYRINMYSMQGSYIFEYIYISCHNCWKINKKKE